MVFFACFRARKITLCLHWSVMLMLWYMYKITQDVVVSRSEMWI